jgi:hypothetical protein
LVIAGDITDSELEHLHHSYQGFESDLTHRYRQAIKVDALIIRHTIHQIPLTGRPYAWWAQKRMLGKLNLSQNRDEFFRLTLSKHRAHHILIELRRYQNKTGQWPPTLEQIGAPLGPTALIDPLSKKSFVYRRTHGSFMLYSVGPNGIDQNGRYESSPPDESSEWDDQTIWPQKQSNRN